MIKKTRLIIQLLFFILFSLVIYKIVDSQKVISFFHSFHFLNHLSLLAWVVIPTFFLWSLISLIHPLFIGRIYCSYICPVGFIQDILSLIKLKKIKKKRGYFPYIPAFILGITLYLWFLGKSWYGIFDHYSNFIRLITINHSYGTIIVFIFITLLLFSIFFPRFFCHTICPSGTIYSFLQKKSLYKIKINESCNGCKLCEKSCPTLAIKDQKIHNKSCIYCFECFDACPTKAFTLKRTKIFKKRDKSKKIKTDRRLFFKQFFSFAIGSGFSALSIKQIPIPKKTDSVIPPGGNSFTQFIEKCTFCGQCIAICPTGVLENSKSTNGIYGKFRPIMNYNTKFCSFECNACLSVCPTGALTYYPLKHRQSIKMGTARIDKKTCIPYAKKRDCAACAEHCPTGAVDMHKDQQYKHMVPKVADDYCIGCGACQQICPTTPLKSIIIEPQSIHTFAHNPKKKKRAASEVEGIDRIKKMNDFPF